MKANKGEAASRRLSERELRGPLEQQAHNNKRAVAAVRIAFAHVVAGSAAISTIQVANGAINQKLLGSLTI